MAEMDTPLLIQTMQELIRTIRENSPAAAGNRGDQDGFGGTNRRKTNTERFKENKRDPAKSAEDRLRLEKAMKEGTKALKDTFKQTGDYAKDMKLASGMFQNAIGKLSLKAFNELPKRITDMTKDLGFEFKSTADIQRTFKEGTFENITAMKALHEKLLTLKMGTTEYNKTLKEIDHGWSQDISLLALPTEKLQENFLKLGQTVNTTTKAIDDLGKSSSTAAKAGTLLAEVLLYAAKQGLDATLASAKFGVEILPLAKDMKLLGMSADELAVIQNKNIQAIRGAGISFGDFDNMIIAGSRDLAAYTGDLKSGAIIYADAFRNFRMLSASTKDQNKFITETAKTYKFMHDTVGTTAEQFQQLTEQLMSNHDVQVNMYRLNESQRVQAMLDLQTQDALLKTYGLLEPEAQAVVQTFAQIGAQGPKERLKQAAQLQAVGGALGMGKEAAQLAALIRSGDTNSPEAIKLARELQQRAQAQYANVKGTSGEFAQYALTNLPGVQQILGQSGPLAQTAIRKGVATPPDVANKAEAKANGEMSAEDKKKQAAVEAVVTINDEVKGIKGLLEIIAATLAIPTLSGILKKGFSWGFGKLLGKGASTVVGEGALAGEGALVEGAGATGLGAAGVGAGGLAVGGAALLGAGAVGYGVGTLIDMIPKLFGSEENFSDMIGGVVANHFGPKLNDTKSPEATKRDTIISSMIKDRAALEKGNLNDKEQKAMLDQLDALTAELAKMNGKDPTKAIEDLHKTLKMQHQENKDLTQEQTDTIKRTKVAKMVKTTDNLGKTS